MASLTYDHLTGREQEVLALVAHGLSQREIARNLYITRATVQYHLRNIHWKLGARSQAHAVHLAYQLAYFTTGTEPSAAARAA